LAEYRDLQPRFAAAGARVAFLSVDPPWRSARVHRDLALTFPLLCDVDKHIVTAWGLLNEREAGGIAKPAAFIVRPNRTIGFASVDEVTRRIGADDVLAALAAAPKAAAEQPQRRAVRARLNDFVQSARGLLGRRGRR
jgi:peroxiredoxin